jgi:hypothetical protein
MSLRTGGQQLWVLRPIGYWEKMRKLNTFIQE